MLREAGSGLNSAAGRMRSAAVMGGEPPVVRLITALVLRLGCSRIGTKCSGFWEGRPSSGSRACMWTMAAPASAAPTAASAISCGDTGRYFDIDGVWMAPVTALVMITLRACDMTDLSPNGWWSVSAGPVPGVAPHPADRGVRAGDVAMLAGNSADALAVAFACWVSGACHLPLNLHETAERHSFILRDADARLLVHGPSTAQAAQALASRAGIPALTAEELRAKIGRAHV